MDADPLILFTVATPLGFSIMCTEQYWRFIVTEKHPSLKGREFEVEATLSDPEEIRLSRIDSGVYLFYRAGLKRFVCAVARRENSEGFLIMAYPTDAIKSGVQVWKR
jgi:hypothetical protein